MKESLNYPTELTNRSKKLIYLKYTNLMLMILILEFLI